MENRAHALAAGIFVIVMGLTLFAAIAWFQGEHIQRTYYTVVSKSGVSGLNIKAPVKLRGVEIGKVEDIVFDPKDPRQVLVKIGVDATAPITRGTFAQLGLQGVTGLSFIDLQPSGNDTALLVAGANAPPIELRPTLFDQLKETGPELVAGLTEGIRRLNQLLGDENQKQLATALNNLGETSTQATKLVAALQPAAEAMPALVKNANSLVARANSVATKIDSAADDASALAKDLRTRAIVLDRFGSVAQQVEITTRQLELALIGPSPQRSRPLFEEIAAGTAALGQAADEISDQPQSLLFGRTQPLAGPGEAGFDARARGAR